jgi:hypothetical protein
MTRTIRRLHPLSPDYEAGEEGIRMPFCLITTSIEARFNAMTAPAIQMPIVAIKMMNV